MTSFFWKEPGLWFWTHRQGGLHRTIKQGRPDPSERFCTHFNFEPMAFDTADEHGSSIYHTNVMMCIATDFAMVGFDIISKPERREEIRAQAR